MDNNKNTNKTEPSMEDILASIRRILSEDKNVSAVFESDDESLLATEKSVFDLTPEMIISPLEKKDNKSVFELTPEMTTTVRANATYSNDVRHSADTLAVLAGEILHKKTATAKIRNLILEDLVREILQPLLKEWTHANLPSLIERLVKKEIEHMIKNRTQD